MRHGRHALHNRSAPYLPCRIIAGYPRALITSHVPYSPRTSHTTKVLGELSAAVRAAARRSMLVPDREHGQALRVLVDHVLGMLNDAALHVRKRQHRVKRAAAVGPLRRHQGLWHRLLCQVSLAEARAHNEDAALAGCVWFGVDVRLRRVGCEVHGGAVELAKVGARTTRIKALQAQALNQVRRCAVVQQPLVQLEALESLDVDERVTSGVYLGELLYALLAQAGDVLKLGHILLLQPRVVQLLDSLHLKQRHAAVWISLPRSAVACA
eukprot:scaffold25591_cov72-Phaeocystis_antarctica.AAC.2